MNILRRWVPLPFLQSIWLMSPKGLLDLVTRILLDFLFSPVPQFFMATFTKQFSWIIIIIILVQIFFLYSSCMHVRYENFKPSCLTEALV